MSRTWVRLKIEGTPIKSLVELCPVSRHWRAIMLEMNHTQRAKLGYGGLDADVGAYYICAQTTNYNGYWIEQATYAAQHPLATHTWVSTDPIEAMGLLHKLAHEDIPKALTWLDPDCLRVSTGRKPTT